VTPHSPTHQSVLWITLAAVAILWLLLLQATHFNIVTVSLGLLVVVGVIS